MEFKQELPQLDTKEKAIEILSFIYSIAIHWQLTLDSPTDFDGVANKCRNAMIAWVSFASNNQDNSSL